MVALPLLLALACTGTTGSTRDAATDSGSDSDSGSVTDSDSGPVSDSDSGSVTDSDSGPVSSPDAGPAPDTILWQARFDTHPDGAYSTTLLAADFLDPVWSSGIDEGRVRIDGGALCVLYPAGGVGPGEGGAQWPMSLGASYDELFLSYRVRFDGGFAFVRGGKLPGLVGGTANTGGERPTGYDGWSARMMWRTAGAAVQYVYHVDQPTVYGEDFDWTDASGADRVFVPGTWHRVEHRIVMNTATGDTSPRDGIVEAWFDGEPALDRRDVRFRLTDAFAIDALYFSTFFGGSDATWAPPSDQRICFDDFVISTARVP